MKYLFCTIGKLRKPWAIAAAEEYLQRLNPKPGTQVLPVIPRANKPDSTALLCASSKSYRIALDRTGKLLSSTEWAQALAGLEQEGQRSVAFLIGSADGHQQELLCQVDQVWSFGKLTLPHELALVVAVEQLYRACAIRANSPYHRD